MRVAILASGPSLSDEDVAYIHAARNDGRLQAVVAVSDVGILKAPWADALCSHDSSWWIAKPKALDFTGKKYAARAYQTVEQFNVQKLGMVGGLNSGLFAMYVARDLFKATNLILLGFDMHRRNGQHFFGPHTETCGKNALRNTNEKTFYIHIRQFNRFSGCDVVNCTPDSDLNRFPKAPLREVL